VPFLIAHPNPFSKLTTVSFGKELGAESIELKIYDSSGRMVRDLLLPTAYSVVPTTISWDGTDQFGQTLPSGVYFIRLEGDDYRVSQKIVKLK
jgi:flagellar hook assembly protein FlgD